MLFLFQVLALACVWVILLRLCYSPSSLLSLSHPILDFSRSLCYTIRQLGQLCRDLQRHPAQCHGCLTEHCCHDHIMHGACLTVAEGVVPSARAPVRGPAMKISAVSVVFGNIMLIFPFCPWEIEWRIRSLILFLEILQPALIQISSNLIEQTHLVSLGWCGLWKFEVMAAGI